MTSRNYDVVVIGAGIVGAACAAECAKELLSVAIVEAKMIGGAATAAGMGHLVVMDDSEAQFALTRYSQTLWDELKADLPRDVEYDACGTIWVAANEEEQAEVRRKEKFYTERGVRVEVLDRQALAEAEPNLRSGLVGGLRVPGDSVIYPPCAAQFLVGRARSCGGRRRRGLRPRRRAGAGRRRRCRSGPVALPRTHRDAPGFARAGPARRRSRT